MLRRIWSSHNGWYYRRRWEVMRCKDADHVWVDMGVQTDMLYPHLVKRSRACSVCNAAEVRIVKDLRPSVADTRDSTVTPEGWVTQSQEQSNAR